MNLVEAYWSGVARRLQEEVDSFNFLIGHAGEQGKENEQSLINLLVRLLPRSLGVGSGLLMDATGQRSKQTDVIIFDSVNQPAVMGQTTQVLFPVANVFGVAEVKTTLSNEEPLDCGEKRASLHALSPAGGAPIPFNCVFAYHAEHTPPTMAQHIRAVKDEHRPDLLCVVSAGIIAGRGSSAPGPWPARRCGRTAGPGCRPRPGAATATRRQPARDGHRRSVAAPIQSAFRVAGPPRCGRS